MRCCINFVSLMLCCGLALAEPVRADDREAAHQLNIKVMQLSNEGNYSESLPLAEESVALHRTIYGSEDVQLIVPLFRLAAILRELRRLDDAEPNYAQALAIAEKKLGANDPRTAAVLNGMAGLRQLQGRHDSAETLYNRALEQLAKSKPIEPTILLGALNDFAGFYVDRGRYTEAETLYDECLDIAEQLGGQENRWFASALGNLAVLRNHQGRYSDSIDLQMRSLALTKTVNGPEHPSVATTLNNIAWTMRDQGRFAEAESYYRQSLALTERTLGANHASLAVVLDNLGQLYQTVGRQSESGALYNRSLAIKEASFGPDHPVVAITLNNIGWLYRDTGRYADAEPYYQRSLAMSERHLGGTHPEVANTLNSLAWLHLYQGRYDEAEQEFKRALIIAETSFGDAHPRVATSVNNLAGLYRLKGQFAEARSHYQRALTLRENALGSEHPDVAITLDNMALLAVAQSDWPDAVKSWQRATSILQKRVIRGDGADQSRSQGQKGEITRSKSYFLGLMKAASRVSPRQDLLDEASIAEMFEAAQWAQSSEAAATLEQTAIRAAAKTPEIAAMVRERQDLVSEWESKDKQLIVMKSERPESRDAEREDALSERVSSIESRIVSIDDIFKTKFSNFAQLTRPKPVPVADVQATLQDNEALILFMDTSSDFRPLPEETFVWVVTKTNSRWVKSNLGSKSLGDLVFALRCGLDRTAWRNEGRDLCNSALGLNRPLDDTSPLPFDATKSNELYDGLFHGVEDLLVNGDGTGKSLLLVLSGALTALPFQVLVTEPSQTSRWSSADTSWLIQRHTLTVLPSVASLTGLRRQSKQDLHAPDTRAPFIGFGNPVLEGHSGCKKIRIPTDCPEVDAQVATLETDSIFRDAGEAADLQSFFRSGLADVAAVSTRLCPLPDTTHELSCVARSLGASQDSVVDGAEMTETKLKGTDLARYNVVHFATHGLLAGETSILALDRPEPSLVMTPPSAPTELDDGLLTASEVSGLKMNADWVVMSACNTAGAGAPGSEALSGLAKAFFYAGARSLLVSHWPVNSNAATFLTSRTFAELKDNPKLGRAVAFQRAMLALMRSTTFKNATHPSVWAPFIVVGDGAM